MTHGERSHISTPGRPISGHQLCINGLSCRTARDSLRSIFGNVKRIGSIRVVCGPHARGSGKCTFIRVGGVRSTVHSISVLRGRPFVNHGLLIDKTGRHRRRPHRPHRSHTPERRRNSVTRIGRASAPLLRPRTPTPRSRRRWPFCRTRTNL